MRKRTDRPWKEEVKDLFSVHAAERRGFTILALLCLFAAAWVTYEQFIRPDPVKDLAKIEVAWKELEKRDTLRFAGQHTSGAEHREERSHELFPFDPNHLPIDRWVALGLSEKQAATIHHYEDKGGVFRTKRDVAKMRVVDADLFIAWMPFIQLPDSLEKHDRFTASTEPASTEHMNDRGFPARERPSLRRLEVNTADTVQLVAMPGIGPAFARGIVKYRDRLGGFHSLDQLAEVYVLRDKPDAVERLRSLLDVDTLMMRRFPVNSFTAEELGPHPYAGWKVAKALVAYRKQHGPFKNIADIKGCVLVTDSVYRKLAPYLSAE